MDRSELTEIARCRVCGLLPRECGCGRSAAQQGLPPVIPTSARGTHELQRLTEQTQRLVRQVPKSMETIFTDPETGGKKGDKPERFDLIPWDVMAEVARLYGKGAEKYEDRNWEKGYPNRLSMAALMRHLTAFWQDREDYDPETGCHHLASVIFHALAMMAFQKRGIGTDDRPQG